MEERTKGSGRASKTSNDSKTAGEHKTNAGMYSSGVAHQPMVERLARCLCESHTPASTSGCRANAAAAAAAMDGTRRRQRRTWRPAWQGQMLWRSSREHREAAVEWMVFAVPPADRTNGGGAAESTPTQPRDAAARRRHADKDKGVRAPPRRGVLVCPSQEEGRKSQEN